MPFEILITFAMFAAFILMSTTYDEKGFHAEGVFLHSHVVELQEVDGSACSALRRVFVSGEALPPTSVAKFLEVLPNAQLHNLYGPTEATVDVTGVSVSLLFIYINEVNSSLFKTCSQPDKHPYV